MEAVSALNLIKNSGGGGGMSLSERERERESKYCFSHAHTAYCHRYYEFINLMMIL